MRTIEWPRYSRRRGALPPYPDSQIEALLDQIDRTVGKLDVGTHFRPICKIVADQRHDHPPAEGVRYAQAQQSAWLAIRSSDACFRLVYSVKDTPSALMEALAFRCKAYGA